MRRTILELAATAVVVGCASAPGSVPSTAGEADASRSGRLERLLGALAHDSLMGRRVGTPGIRMAADLIAQEMERIGVKPAGDEGYFQAVPMARVGGRQPFIGFADGVDFDTLPDEAQVPDQVNVIGIVFGTDRTLRDEYVVLGAHYDHVGVGEPVDGDSIYNGADDDGSGTAAVLEIARALATDPPSRSVVIFLATAEETGMIGAWQYMDAPAVPLERTVADLQIEMIGRPDSLAGGFGRGWLTGYERTTVGDRLAGAGSPIVPDPRPEMRFFFRSDNFPFAVRGVPAHTLSSFGLHEDYHRPSDEVDGIDFEHMAALVDAAEEAVRLLADGPRPEWKEGGREGLPGG